LIESFESTQSNHNNDGIKESGYDIEKDKVRIGGADLDSSDSVEAIAKSIHELNKKVFCRLLRICR